MALHSSMLDRRRLLGGAAALAVSGCAAKQDYLRFRLKLSFVVGARPIEASSVRETWYIEDPPWFPSDGTGNFGWRGEATIADLGRDRLIAAMLDGYTMINGYRERSYAPWNPAAVLMERFGANLSTDAAGRTQWSEASRPTVAELRSDLRRPLLLEPHELPVLVAFATPSIRGSGLVIQPADIPEVFPDVRLGRCTVALTSDPPRFGIVDSALPWVEESPGKATIYTPPIKSGRVMTEDFQRK